LSLRSIHTMKKSSTRMRRDIYRSIFDNISWLVSESAVRLVVLR
jgi:hypothetical protein